MISREVRDWNRKGKRKIQILIIITNQLIEQPLEQDQQIIVFWEVTNFGLICIIPLISLAFSSEDGELKNIYVLSLYIFLDDLYLESQGCQQLQSVDINYQSFTSCDFPSLAG